MEPLVIDAKGMHYTPLNKQIRAAVASGVKEIVLNNVLGQRFIGNGLRGDDVKITINGVPGGDLGMFMSGPECVVYGNADHASGNTMDSGTLVVHGSSGDAVAHSMRGGKVFVRDSIGYRGGIHMKEYGDKRPILVVGGTSHSFLGEYMAGGLILILGIGHEVSVHDRGIGSGIHGGEIIIRGNVNEKLLGVGAKTVDFTEDDLERLAPIIKEFCGRFDIDPTPFLDTNYSRIVPASSRPFAGKYTWE
jgi:glutamate synthase domain-containing protein 3